MKKCVVILFAVAITLTCYTNNIKFLIKQPLSAQQLPQLSTQQLTELNYLDQKLNSFDDTTKQDWTRNESVRILIELTELAIQQSSPTTQSIMKQLVINILKDHGINIVFTSKNIIQRTDNDYLDSIEDIVEDFIDKNKKKRAKKHHVTIRPPTKQTIHEIEKQKSISGKRRTLNKIKRDIEEKAKKDAALQAKQRALDALVKQKNLDEIINRKALIDTAFNVAKQQYEASVEEQRANMTTTQRREINEPHEHDAIHNL